MSDDRRSEEHLLMCGEELPTVEAAQQAAERAAARWQRDLALV